jgi:S-adenosyl-L-methionine hydrolase (adenosine-forming)
MIAALTTDFGLSSPYVAQMKAVLLAAVPDVRLVDVTHDLPPQSLRHAEVVLRAAAFAFPLGTVHLVVVDPGVGTERRPIAVRSRGLTFVGPDNGVLGIALEQPDAKAVVLDRPELFRHPVSPTFHGRDIFAPVAAVLGKGLALEDVGSAITDAVPSRLPKLRREGGRSYGETLVADSFGNLLTNIPGAFVKGAVIVAGKSARLVRTYHEGAQGEILALTGSDGYLEIAVRDSSAATVLGGEILPVECESP